MRRCPDSGCAPAALPEQFPENLSRAGRTASIRRDAPAHSRQAAANCIAGLSATLLARFALRHGNRVPPDRIVLEPGAMCAGFAARTACTEQGRGPGQIRPGGRACEGCTAGFTHLSLRDIKLKFQEPATPEAVRVILPAARFYRYSSNSTLWEVRWPGLARLCWEHGGSQLALIRPATSCGPTSQRTD
jgi:hypothetical protein